MKSTLKHFIITEVIAVLIAILLLPVISFYIDYFAIKRYDHYCLTEIYPRSYILTSPEKCTTSELLAFPIVSNNLK